MHKSSYLRMAWFVDEYLNDQTKSYSILDCGSYGVNGSYRQLFTPPHTHTQVHL